MPGHYDPATIRSQLVRSDGRLSDPHFRTRLPSVSITRSHSGPRTSFWDPQAPAIHPQIIKDFGH
jgi:hypothetical protein